MPDSYLSLYNLELNEAPFSAKFIKMAPESLPPECLLPSTPSLPTLPDLDTTLPALDCKFDILEPIIPPAYFCTPALSGTITVHTPGGPDTTITVERTPDTECDYQFNGDIELPCTPELTLLVDDVITYTLVNGNAQSTPTLEFSVANIGTPCEPLIKITPSFGDIDLTLPCSTKIGLGNCDFCDPDIRDLAQWGVLPCDELVGNNLETAVLDSNTELSMGKLTFSLNPLLTDHSCEDDDPLVCRQKLTFEPEISLSLDPACDGNTVSRIIGSYVAGTVDLTVGEYTIGTLDLAGEVKIEDGEGPCSVPVIRVQMTPEWSPNQSMSLVTIDVCVDGDLMQMDILASAPY